MASFELLDSIYRKKLLRDGVALSGVQLFAEARKKKNKISMQTIYDYLRQQAPGSAGRWGVAPARPKNTAGFSPIKPGQFFIDYGEFHKDWANQNNGATGFLVAVEQFTGRTYVTPTRGKDTRQWIESIAEFVQKVKQVASVYSDRDSVATAPAFIEEMSRKYNISWKFLKKGNKSYTAERMIGVVKTALSKVLESQEGRRRWIDLVEPFVASYNSQYVGNTRYTRQAVARENFDDFLKAVTGSEQPELKFNADVAGPFASENWNSKIFKFKIGDKVRVSRDADWTKPKSAFAKPTMKGSFSSKIYTICGRQLRTGSGIRSSVYVPVYKLSEMEATAAPGGGCHFYETELQLASRPREGEKK